MWRGIAALSQRFLLLFLLQRSSLADKDDSYYNANSGNPNVDVKMYWKDGENILQDLSQFEALYVEFHSCVWSWLKYGDDDMEEIDENDYWYMGSVPPMGANVAFSLYGTLRGEGFKGCGKDTFINSFYTNTGFTAFTDSLKAAGVSGFNSYTSSYLTAECQGGYGIGCDKNGFGKHKYSDSECDPYYYSGSSDSMSGLNSAMKSAQCIQIFSASNWQGYDYVSGSAVELLAYSTACTYMNYKDGNCPDPYGRISYYVNNFNKGIKKKRQDPWKIYHNNMAKGIKMLVAGVVLLAAAGFLYYAENHGMLEEPKKKAIKKYPIVRRKIVKGVKAARSAAKTAVAKAKTVQCSDLEPPKSMKELQDTYDTTYAACGDGYKTCGEGLTAGYKECGETYNELAQDGSGSTMEEILDDELSRKQSTSNFVVTPSNGSEGPIVPPSVTNDPSSVHASDSLGLVIPNVSKASADDDGAIVVNLEDTNKEQDAANITTNSDSSDGVVIDTTTAPPTEPDSSVTDSKQQSQSSSSTSPKKSVRRSFFSKFRGSSKK